MKSNNDWIFALLMWFKKNARYMPWREIQSPYRTWISEIMLQQTQVDTVIDYFNRFVNHFNNLESLANADPQLVLKQWEGLGYYTRAHNLMKCAQHVHTQLNSQFPQKYEELLKLPGIGPYTAAAIASISFNEAIPVVDGNVLRVYARLFAMGDNIKSNTTRDNVFKSLKQPIIASQNPSSFNQGLMELGALICRPQSPLCMECPLSKYCCAFQQNEVEKYPFVEKKAPSPHKISKIHIIMKNNLFLLRKRKEKLWHNLWIFPQFLEDETPDISITHSTSLNHIVHHVFTHFSIDMHLTKSNITGLIPESYGFFSIEQIKELPLPVPHRKIAQILSTLLKSE